MVARDRVSDSERLLCFGGVIFLIFYSRPRITSAIAEDCYILVVLFIMVALCNRANHYIFAL